MNLFDLILINPFLNVLVFFYQILNSVSIPGALGFAIILLTIIIRMALWPLTSVQLKSSQKMAALKPHLDRIKADHGHDKVLHQQEVSKLYKEHGVNPMAGCLPLLLQMPVFIALYQVKNDGPRRNFQTCKNKRKTRPRRLNGPNAVPNDINNALNDCLFLLRFPNWPFTLLEHFYNYWYYPAICHCRAGSTW